MGNFFFGWNEINDKLCDIICSFWCGDLGFLKEFVICFMGLCDFYSVVNWFYKLIVNYIIYYDGFML